jgi:hypothetical protein
MKIDVENSLISSININESNLISEEGLINSYSGEKKSNLNGNTITELKDKEQADRNVIARKKIDELIEKRRLKNLLDDSEDW